MSQYRVWPKSCSTTIGAMPSVVFAILAYIRAFFVPRHRLTLEAAALRQQLAVFKRKQPRPRLLRPDRLFWTIVPTANPICDFLPHARNPNVCAFLTAGLRSDERSHALSGHTTIHMLMPARG